MCRSSMDIETLLKSTPDLLPRSIQFVRAHKKKNASQQHQSKSSKTAKLVQLADRAESAVRDPCFKQPAKELFARHEMKSMLRPVQATRRVGAGLQNLGNTCFLNATMQCLMYTPPLMHYLASKRHTKKCHVRGWCLFCELHRHFEATFHAKQRSFAPQNIARKIKLIGKQFRIGRQEDSHEFTRFALDALERAALSTHAKTTCVRIQETTIVHRIWGGYLRSSVECLQCGHTSNTYDSILDLSLEVIARQKRLNSLDHALRHFTKSEALTGENRYRCDKCRRKVDARKTLTVFEAPNVLTINLKRFSWGQKLGHHVAFQPSLDLRKFVSHPNDGPVKYSLFGVLVHSGHSVHSGHYYSFVKAPNQTWYCCNDSSVSQVSLSSVLQQKAYMLFYVRDKVGVAPGLDPAKLRQTVQTVQHRRQSITRVDVSKHQQQHDNKNMRRPPQQQPAPVKKTVPAKPANNNNKTNDSLAETKSRARLMQYLHTNTANTKKRRRQSEPPPPLHRSVSLDSGAVSCRHHKRRRLGVAKRLSALPRCTSTLTPAKPVLILDDNRDDDDNERIAFDPTIIANNNNNSYKLAETWEDEVVDSAQARQTRRQIAQNSSVELFGARKKQRDSYDDEYDQGRVKKVKTKKSFKPKHGIDVFQKQLIRNQRKAKAKKRAKAADFF